jgi:hypothetical protein
MTLGFQNLKIVAERDQSTVKHPMNSSRKSNAILNQIGSVSFNWLDVCSLSFRTAAPINNAYASNRAPIFINLLYLLRKYTITKWPFVNHQDSWPDDF